METNSIIEKVSKLLALAGNNPNDAEAQAALLKAQELMAKHNIELGQVADSTKNLKKEVVAEYVKGASHTVWVRLIARIITSNFRTNYLINTGMDSYLFIGLKDDVQITISLFNYTRDLLERNMKRLRHNTRKSGSSTYGLSGDYAEGFINGLRDKFAEQVKKEGWGLILVKDDAVIQATKARESGKQNTAKSRLNRRGNADAYNAGYRDGKSVTQQKQINK